MKTGTSRTTAVEVKRSVAWPFRRTARGGLALTPVDDGGQAELRQTIALALLPGPCSQPFAAAAGVGAPEAAFGAGGPDLDRLSVHVMRLFRRLEAAGRARLVPGCPRVERQASAGGGTEVVIVVEFFDLESGQPGQVTVPGR